MFYPAGTIIKTSDWFNDQNKTTVYTVKSIDFDFDPEYVNGIHVIDQNGKDCYIDHIDCDIEVIKYPTQYYTAKDKWLVMVDKITEQSPYFFSDQILDENPWIMREYKIIKTFPASKNFTEMETELHKIIKEEFDGWAEL